jgi:hypothetical protein
MQGLIKVSLRLILVVCLLATGWLKFPHIQLWVLIASGHLNSVKPATVIECTPSIRLQDLQSVRLGALSLEVPGTALTPEAREGLQQGILETRFDDLCFWAVEPRPGWLPPLHEILDPECRALYRDELAVEVAAYAADLRSLSIGMSRRRAIELIGLMEVRRCLCMEVDHIEILKHPGIDGVLVVQAPIDGQIRMFFDYRSSDGALTGLIGFFMPEGSVHGLEIARTIINSIEIDSSVALSEEIRDG